MDVGPFPVIMAAAWLPFLPAVVWEKAGVLFQNWFSKVPRAAHALLLGCAKVLHFIRRKLDIVFPWRPGADYGLRPARATNLLTAVALIYILCWNIRDTNIRQYERWFPASVNWLGHLMRWEQYWGMFAPKPVLDDGWFVSVAKLADGTQVDLLKRGAAVDWEKPHVVSQTFWDSRWQKYMANIWTSRFKECRLPTLRYLTNEWNASHDATKQINSVKLWYVIEWTRPDGTVDPHTKPTELANYVP
jgi:hypothetical protein